MMLCSPKFDELFWLDNLSTVEERIYFWDSYNRIPTGRKFLRTLNCHLYIDSTNGAIKFSSVGHYENIRDGI